MSNTSAALELRLLLKETMNGATRACMLYLNVMIWIVQGVAPRVLSDVESRPVSGTTRQRCGLKPRTILCPSGLHGARNTALCQQLQFQCDKQEEESL